MTKKELQSVVDHYKQHVRKVIQEEIEAPTDAASIRDKFCGYLASEGCYNHHERGQRLWAYYQAWYEIWEEMHHGQ